jgi:hypothetical protein
LRRDDRNASDADPARDIMGLAKAADGAAGN